MRITREEEHYIGRARPGVHARVKVGFGKDGKITAIDLYAVGDNGPYERRATAASAGRTVSLCYQPTAMRWRGDHGAHQHAAANLAARARRDAGQRLDGTGAGQGRATSSASIKCEFTASMRRPARRRSVPAAAAATAGVRHELAS